MYVSFQQPTYESLAMKYLREHPFLAVGILMAVLGVTILASGALAGAKKYEKSTVVDASVAAHAKCRFCGRLMPSGAVVCPSCDRAQT